MMRYLWVICATLLPPIICREFWCDFGDPEDLLISNAAVICHMDLDYYKSAIVTCPHRVENTDYVWHPQPSLDDQAHLNTYVSENGRLRSIAVSDVMRSENTRSLIHTASTPDLTELQSFLSYDKLFGITDYRLIFICAPRDFVMSDALQSIVDRLKYTKNTQNFSWDAITPLTEEVKKIGNGLGIYFFYRGRGHLPLQGCGSRPSPLFATDEVTVDPITGTRSCVVDPMSKSPIGFLCEGRIEPEDCMRSLIDENGEVVAAPESHPYWSFDTHKPWVIATYFHKFALPPFSGECWCIDSETSQVKARIEIRSKTDYVCDITSNIFRNKVRPIRGPWCSVVLHPGSTLTIIFPTKAVDLAPIDKHSDEDLEERLSTVPFSQLPSIYEYETEFLPKDLTTLRQLKNACDDIYNEISYVNALVGDALELDISQMSLGQVKLKYNAANPLTSLGGHNSFFYHWTLISRNENVPDKIRATVNVSFALTHYYRILGCDQGTPSLFHPAIREKYCSTKRMGNGIGYIYECIYRHVWDSWQAGIHCRPDEELLPNNCDNTGYDLHSNRIMPFPGSIRNATLHPIRGFQVLNADFRTTTSVSYACICVDKRGYEISRLILESNREVNYTGIVRRGSESHTLLPYITLPWAEVELSSEGLIPPSSLILYNVSRESIALDIGTTLFMPCDLDQQEVANNGRIATTWLPKQHEEFHYTVNDTPHGPELIRKSHNESFATTPGGLEVKYQEHDRRPGYKHLMVKSNNGAILISKDITNTKYVPITFLCGKTPEQSDFTLTTGDGSASETSAPFIPNSIASSTRYIWDVVDVNVETTDPYMQGCGVTYASDELFKLETPQLYDSDGQPQFGCKINLQAAKETAFYCPAPYVLDPPNCFSQVFVDGSVKNISDLSKSLVSSRSNHFVILEFDSSRVGQGETLRQGPPLECRCVTVKGAVLSTIQIENYYSKY
ncbi:hypothetical protein, conserved [Babesia ovata]|uniref:6-Cys domain-containing protein n=1 Tax=Babesia ovata TaxID=189622 RepID=A0A2H6KAZ1_9APIC|nr:uncharacterized protein BOVATA_016220 [Babesia ovata]GBE60129.1 hypothetical protein, conserved [Babesia ovata]